MPFAFGDNMVRVLRDENGEPLFVAKDVARALEYPETTYANMAKTLQHVPDEWKGRYPIPTLGGTQEMLVLTEQGLYFFVNLAETAIKG
jgi:prophage antirepressor-like protein